MSRWVEKAEKEVEDAYERGEISEKELNEEMRDIRRELEAEAQENAHRAYQDTFNYF